MAEGPTSIHAPASSVVGTTLREHVLHGMHAAPGATGEFTSLLNHLSLAIRIIHSRVRSAGLHGLLGYTGETNVQGEQVQKLDEFSNEVLINVLERSGHCGVIASEEVGSSSSSPRRTGSTSSSSTRSTARATSTRTSASGPSSRSSAERRRATSPSAEDALRPGHEIACAGYALYGPSTILTLSTGQGVHSFTLDPNIGEFFLSHPSIRCPMRGSSYSINEGNYARWTPQVQKWNQWIKSEDKETGPPLRAPVRRVARRRRAPHARSRAGSSRTRPTRSPRRGSSASSTRRTPWPTSSSKRGARRPTG